MIKHTAALFCFKCKLPVYNALFIQTTREAKAPRVVYCVWKVCRKPGSVLRVVQTGTTLPLVKRQSSI